jgi:hypothetical protein
MQRFRPRLTRCALQQPPQRAADVAQALEVDAAPLQAEALLQLRRQHAADAAPLPQRELPMRWF